MRAVERLVNEQDAGGEVEPADLGMRVRLPVFVVLDGRAEFHDERAEDDDGDGDLGGGDRQLFALGEFFEAEHEDGKSRDGVLDFGDELRVLAAFVVEVDDHRGQYSERGWDQEDRWRVFAVTGEHVSPAERSALEQFDSGAAGRRGDQVLWWPNRRWTCFSQVDRTK